MYATVTIIVVICPSVPTIKFVRIVDTITRIGANAFTDCDDLKVQLSDADEESTEAAGMARIGYKQWAEVGGLTSVRPGEQKS